jgi:hypothetical protein
MNLASSSVSHTYNNFGFVNSLFMYFVIYYIYILIYTIINTHTLFKLRTNCAPKVENRSHLDPDQETK